MENRWGLWVGVVAVVAVVSIGLYSGAWAQIPLWSHLLASDVTATIEGVLGEERLMRQRAHDAMQTAQTDIERLQELAVSSTVDAELLDEKIADLRLQDATQRAELGKLAKMLEEGKPVAIENSTQWQLSLYATRRTCHPTSCAKTRTQART